MPTSKNDASKASNCSAIRALRRRQEVSPEATWLDEHTPAKKSNQLHVSPYPGAGSTRPQCSSSGRLPVAVSARRDGAFLSALLCADGTRRLTEGDEHVVARIPER